MNSDAEQPFKENLRLLTDSAGHPTDRVMWNLNKGLLELAHAVKSLQSDLLDIERRVRKMQP